MKNSRILLAYIFLIISYPVFSQIDSADISEKGYMHVIKGFSRAGFYGWTDGSGREPKVSSGYMDVGIMFDKGFGSRFNFFSDFRYRFGYEFMEPVSRFEIREARALISGKKWTATLGQQIIKWGLTDIINPEAMLSPCNYIVRSSDREDINLGNLSARFSYSPVQLISLEAVATPYYRPSVLLADLIQLPLYVSLEKFSGLRTDRTRFTYALRADMHFKAMKMGFSWFDGYNPVPGTMLKGMEMYPSGEILQPFAQLVYSPYRIRNAGIDLEVTTDRTIVKGEATWSVPYKSYKVYEYVPMPEINWVADIERSFGAWHVVAEYSGKMMTGFTKITVVPMTEPGQDQDTFDPTVSGETDINSYIKGQVGAFNRLYNYQLHKWYHSAGLIIGKDILYGKISLSLLTHYNFTSHDLYLNPGISYRPMNRLTINFGLDYYSGAKGSLYDLIESSLNSINAALRIDF